jgi:hypothetical protein
MFDQKLLNVVIVCVDLVPFKTYIQLSTCLPVVIEIVPLFSSSV